MAVSRVDLKNGETLIDLTKDNVNEGSLVVGHTAHGADGEIIEGTNPYELEPTNAAVNTQTSLISQIKTALANKAAGGEGLPTQEKTVDITKNGTVEVLPDDGYALHRVGVSVNVPIPDGYIQPSGTLAITQNGEHNAREYEKVSVDVPIPDGYIQPSGELEITENGTHDVTQYASVEVAVPDREIVLQDIEVTENGTYAAAEGYDGIGQVTVNVESGNGGGGISADDVASCAIAGDLNLTVTTIQNGAFWGNGGITTVNAPNVTAIGERGLQNCGGMVTLNAPELQSIGTYGLGYCYDLNSMNFPKLKTVGAYAFYYCSGVQGDVVLPAVTELPTQSCSRMSGITSIDLPVCTSIKDQVFRYCSKLDTIILRSPTVCTLGNINTLYNMPFGSGKSGGKLYVPSALVESYKAASKWSTILGYATNEIRALEDYTVDGTVTGALDVSKI